MKEFISNRSNEFKSIFALTLLCLVFLAIRLKLGYSEYKFFILWNLFLAFIPYVLVMSLRFRESVHKVTLVVIIIVWLAFLPNAPYILSDLIHLTAAPSNYIIFEALFLLSYALCGLYLGYLSLRDMSIILHDKGWLKKKVFIFIFQNTILFLCAYGVYIGRELRWNSWDVINRPKDIVMDIAPLHQNPIENKEGWLFIGSMSIFLMLTYRAFTLMATHSTLSKKP